MSTSTEKQLSGIITEFKAVRLPANQIEWRAGATTRDKTKAQALPYANPRVYEDFLNSICPDEWACQFKPWGDNRIICELTICGMTRSSTGEENEGFAPGTSAEQQAFKRACVKFGLMAYLYEIPISWVKYDQQQQRLEEIPTLPRKFLPQPKHQGSFPTTGKPMPSNIKPPQSKSPPSDGSIGQQRAEKLRKALVKAGVTGSVEKYVEDTLRLGFLPDLSMVSQAQGLEVLETAKHAFSKRPYAE